MSALPGCGGFHHATSRSPSEVRQDQILKADESCLGRRGTPIGRRIEQAALVHKQHGKRTGIESEHGEGEKAKATGHRDLLTPG